MAFEITQDADNASRKTNIQPLLVLEIDGVDTVFGARVITKKVQIGDPGLLIGGFKIGGLIAVADQKALISFENSTTKITQSINPDRGLSQSISSMRIALVDQTQTITSLITPDELQTPTFDLLGRKCKVWLGFDGTAWKEDFIIVFRGIIDDIEAGAGKITFNIAHPDTKKRTQIFQKAETELNGSINSSLTTITVDSTAKFFIPVTGPDLTIDTAIKFFIRINDEIMRYETKTGTEFTTVTRGALGTTAVAHDDGDSAESFITFTEDAITLALKIMLSGKNGPFVEDVTIKNVGFVTGVGTVANSLFFEGRDVQRDFGIVTGDFITTTGAANGANNVTLKTINNIVQVDSGSYIVIDSVSFVTEVDTAAVVDFRSQYDTFGEGLAMDADEVDVPEHERILRLFLSSFNYDFFIKDTIEGKKFIEEDVYNPAGAFGLPRKSQSSVGIHAGPLPGTDIQTLDSSNVTNPAGLIIRRSTALNFQNTVTYRFEEQALEDKFLRIIATTNADSLAQIPIGVKSLNITAKGLRTALAGDTLAATATSRRLRKYKFGAEFIKNMKVNFKTGFRIEVGDIVLVDLDSLNISDIKEGGTRNGEARLFQIDNKAIDFKTGQVTLSLVDTNFDKDARFGTISPSSQIKTGTSTTQFVIEESFSSVFGINEFKKWEDLIGASIRVHNSTYSVDGNAILDQISGNTITLASTLGFTPSTSEIMELDVYDNQPENVKLIFAFWSNGASNFADDGIPYQWF